MCIVKEAKAFSKIVNLIQGVPKNALIMINDAFFLGHPDEITKCFVNSRPKELD